MASWDQAQRLRFVAAFGFETDIKGMRGAAADTLSHSTTNDSVPGGTSRDRKFQRVVLEQPDPGLCIAAFRPPTGNHFDEARCNGSRIEYAAVQKNGVGPAGCGVRVQEARQLSRDRGVLGVRQSEL